MTGMQPGSVNLFEGMFLFKMVYAAYACDSPQPTRLAVLLMLR